MQDVRLQDLHVGLLPGLVIVVDEGQRHRDGQGQQRRGRWACGAAAASIGRWEEGEVLASRSAA